MTIEQAAEKIFRRYNGWQNRSKKGLNRRLSGGRTAKRHAFTLTPSNGANLSRYGMIAPGRESIQGGECKPVTLYDVAEYAGVSYQTVSAW